MKNRMISIATFILALMVIGEAQSITGTYQLHSVRVVYRNHVRAATHADDVDIQGVYGTWVVPYGGSIVEVDADTNGVADYKHPLVGGHIGANVTVESFPEARDPFYLLNYIGVNLTVGLDQEAGTAIIPGDPTVPSTYPTTETANCVTALTVAAVTDNQTNIYKGPVVNPNGNVVWGFGIQQSDVFDWFKPIDPAKHYPKKNHAPKVAGVDSSWGMIVGKDATENADGTMRFKNATIRWHAFDGSYATGGSPYGVDDEGNLNRQLGVSITADIVTIPGMVAWGAAKGATVVAGDYPMINGKGFNSDKLSFTPGEQLMTHTSVGGTWDGVGYIADFHGADGVPFSGDEPLAYTGYYITKNFLSASGAWAAALAVADLTDPTAALTAAATAITTAFGLDSTVAAAVVSSAATTLGASLAAAVAELMAGGMDAATAGVAAFGKVAASGPTVLLGTMAGAGIVVNDSDKDFDLTSTTGGRLLFKVDANTVGGICLPVQQTRDVYAHFTNTVDWVAPTAPHKPLTISDESNTPSRFALHNNYPNPFNPVTTISFDLPEEIYTEVAVYNMMGQKVRTLHSGNMTAGSHHIFFDGIDDQNQQLGSGVYFYRVVAGEFQATKKMMLIK